LNASSTHTAHGTFSVPSTLSSPPTSLPHRTLCPKPAPSPITYHAFLAYTPSAKSLSAAPSPSRTTTTTHTACRVHISITDPLHLDRALSPPECLSSSLQFRECKVVCPSRTHTRESSRIRRDTAQGLQTPGGREEQGWHATCCAYQTARTPRSTSHLSSISASAFPSTPAPPLLVLFCGQDTFRLAPRPPVGNPGRAPQSA
jgi:hypothetical protein